MRTDNPVVVAVRDAYPGFDNSLWSKCQRPWKYGIGLIADARRRANEALGRCKKCDKRKGHTLSWRAEETLLTRLQTARESLGITTYQEFISLAVIRYCDEIERGFEK